jgi:hypothetical protein
MYGMIVTVPMGQSATRPMVLTPAWFAWKREAAARRVKAREVAARRPFHSYLYEVAA